MKITTFDGTFTTFSGGDKGEEYTIYMQNASFFLQKKLMFDVMLNTRYFTPTDTSNLFFQGSFLWTL